MPGDPAPTFPPNFEWDDVAGEGGDGADDDLVDGRDTVPMQS